MVVSTAEAEAAASASTATKADGFSSPPPRANLIGLSPSVHRPGATGISMAYRTYGPGTGSRIAASSKKTQDDNRKQEEKPLQKPRAAIRRKMKHAFDKIHLAPPQFSITRSSTRRAKHCCPENNTGGNANTAEAYLSRLYVVKNECSECGGSDLSVWRAPQQQFGSAFLPLAPKINR